MLIAFIEFHLSDNDNKTNCHVRNSINCDYLKSQSKSCRWKTQELWPG